MFSLSPRRRALLLALGLAPALCGALPAASSSDAPEDSGCLVGGVACGEAEVELAEDAAAGLLRVELLQQSLLARQGGRGGRSLDLQEANDSLHHAAALNDTVNGSAAGEAQINQTDHSNATFNDNSTAVLSEVASHTAEASPSAVGFVVNATAAAGAATERPAGARGAGGAVRAGLLVQTGAATNHTSQDNATPAPPVGSAADDSESARVVAVEIDGATGQAESVAAAGAGKRDELLTESDVDISRVAAQILQEQFPDAFRDAFKDIVGSAGRSAQDAAASILDATLNETLRVVHDRVDPLVGQCMDLREAMFGKMNDTFASAEQGLQRFQSAVDEGVEKFMRSWEPVLFALQALHAAVPAALRTAGLNDLANTADAGLGGGNGLLGLAGSVATALRNVSTSLDGLEHSSLEVAARQLRAADEATQQFMDEAESFGDAFLERFSNWTGTAAQSLGTSSGAFTGSQQTAADIVDQVLDSTRELGQGIGEASALTGVQPPAAEQPQKETDRGERSGAAGPAPLAAAGALALALLAA